MIHCLSTDLSLIKSNFQIAILAANFQKQFFKKLQILNNQGGANPCPRDIRVKPAEEVSPRNIHDAKQDNCLSLSLHMNDHQIPRSVLKIPR